MKTALSLVSGGIDSPVAAYLMQKQGYSLVGLHFSSELITDNEPEVKTTEACKILGIEKLIVIDFNDALIQISKKCSRKLYFVLMKRMMYRVAEKIAEKEKISFLVTGESLGQVSSQTLQNLAVLSRAANIPVLRPLLGFDKQETIKIAQEIGTFKASCSKEHCDALGPQQPSTRAKLEDVLEEEKKLELGSIVSTAVDSAKIIEPAVLS